MKNMQKLTMALATIGLMAGIAGADIGITNLAQSYTQDFNTLPTQDTGTFTWTDNSTLDGWYRRANVSNADQTPDPDLVDYAVKGSSVSTSGFYNVSSAGNSDRAVGFRVNGQPAGLKKGSLGVIFDNNTGTTLTGFDLSYHGEKWYQSVNETTLLFQWRVVDSFADINNDIDRAQTGWNDAGALSWTVAGGAVNTWVNGTEAANSTNFSGSVTNNMSLAPGQKLVIRWRIAETGVGRAGLMIDDVQINNWVSASPVTPESLYADWLNGYQPALGANTNLTDNPDNDALNNLYEYAVGGNPTNAADAGYASSYAATQDSGTNYIEYVYYKRDDAEARGLGYYLELTDNLTIPAWTNAGYEVTGEAAGAPGFNTVTNRVPVAKAAEFIRLKIELN